MNLDKTGKVAYLVLRMDSAYLFSFSVDWGSHSLNLETDALLPYHRYAASLNVICFWVWVGVLVC
jgi:hypothetical protein